mmetsp:Transcript_27598/g.71449  ORF Transcript_27598/g.71449 Transcript_27598/m.71449 type:complete len:212 (-) Transcript_27598:657-1292(-)
METTPRSPQRRVGSQASHESSPKRRWTPRSARRRPRRVPHDGETAASVEGGATGRPRFPPTTPSRRTKNQKPYQLAANEGTLLHLNRSHRWPRSPRRCQRRPRPSPWPCGASGISASPRLAAERGPPSRSVRGCTGRFYPPRRGRPVNDVVPRCTASLDSRGPGPRSRPTDTSAPSVSHTRRSLVKAGPTSTPHLTATEMRRLRYLFEAVP